MTAPSHWNLLPRAIEAVGDVTELPAVSLAVDGTSVVAAFEVDPQEHDRRSAAGVGAVTSTAVLHGLWLIPSGIPVPAGCVPPVKRRRLRGAPHFVAEGPSGFERLYSPPGVVRVVGFTRRDTTRAIERAAGFTPIVQRMVLTDRGAQASNRSIEAACEYGIGLVDISGERTNLIVEPRAAVLGVPAVYRWWIAELAYESWLQESAQPVS